MNSLEVNSASTWLMDKIAFLKRDGFLTENTDLESNTALFVFQL